jgi:hypothetical protein
MEASVAGLAHNLLGLSQSPAVFSSQLGFLASGFAASITTFPVFRKPHSIILSSSLFMQATVF